MCYPCLYNVGLPVGKGRMQFDTKTFLCALGLAFIIEGTPYFLFPERMQSVLRQLSESAPMLLRGLGTLAMAGGLLLVWLGRS